MSTIAQIIEIARSTQHRDSHSADKALRDHAIAMAEALVKIAEPLPWPANSDALRLSDIARECLNRIVKELMP